MSYDGLSPEELACRLRTPSCLSLARVTSTLDIIHELAAEGAPAGTVVLADEQVAGRGRLGRKWSSPPNSGIWLSYLVRPSQPLEGGVLAIRVGLAVLSTLEEIGVAAYLKWPNDVVVSDRKLAGVLCEGRWLGTATQWVAVGVGINVRAPADRAIDREAATLDEFVPEITRVSVLERLVPKLHAMPHQPRVMEEERERFDAHDWLAGKNVQAPLRGSACGIDGDGALLVRTANGVERILGGSVVTA